MEHLERRNSLYVDMDVATIAGRSRAAVLILQTLRKLADDARC